MAVGPTEISGVCAALAAGLRRAGAEAEVVLWRPPNPRGYPANRVLGRLGRAVYSLLLPFRRDVAHYQFGCTWVPWYLDAWWARAWGRARVVTYHGDDCRLYGVARELFPARGRAGDPAVDDGRRLRMRRLSRVTQAALVNDLELATYVRPSFNRVYVTPLALHETERYRPAAPRSNTEPLIILHAPTDPVIKGTDAIRAAVAVAAKQVPLELRVLTGVGHDVVARELGRADLVVDQLNSVTVGIFALEALRAGVPVLCEFDRAALAPFQRDIPVVAVTAETLAAELVALARDPARRAELGAEGPAFIAATHDADRVASAALQIYAHVRSAPLGIYEATAEGITRLDPRLLR